MPEPFEIRISVIDANGKTSVFAGIVENPEREVIVDVVKSVKGNMSVKLNGESLQELNRLDMKKARRSLFGLLRKLDA